MNWLSLWLTWTVGGIALIAATLITGVDEDDTFDHWGPGCLVVFFLACGPVLWASMLAVAVERRR